MRFFICPVLKYLTSVKYLFLVLLLAVACHNFRDQPVSGTQPEEKAEIAFSIDTTHLNAYELSSRATVREFYHRSGYSPYWFANRTPKPVADSLLTFLRYADHLGLVPDDYHVGELEFLLQDSLSTDKYSRIDVLLTDGYLTLHHHLNHGRLDTRTLERLDFASTLDADALAALEKIHHVASMKDLRELEPAAGQYPLLKHLLPGFVASGQSDTIQRKRAMTIAINMERLRWKRKSYDRYITVNIPAFMLRVIEKDSLWLETKVIVGKPETPTPVMESIIRSFIIYPYWHAPFSIATKELLPALQNDAAYLRKNNFEVLNRAGKVILPDTIQWDLYSRDYFPFILRQREGFENSMGIIKFVFANNYGVYLHDTNSKRLFSAAKRDLSHGCVRVSNAVALAHYLVREDDIYVSPEDLDQYLSLQQRLTIELRKPIHLRLDYFTAEVREGVPFFYEDIYKKDSVMMQALYPPVGDGVHRHLVGL